MIPIYILAIEDESDREYMSSLYVQYHRLMYSTIQKSIQDSWLVDDVMQTTFEKLIDKIPLLKTLSRDRLVNYILSSCKNNAYNALRYQNRHDAVGFDDINTISTTDEQVIKVEARLIRDEELSYLSRIWPSLDQRSQYLLRAKYILEKSTSEIAADLDIKPDSVRMALSRARKEAYKLIEKEMNKR